MDFNPFNTADQKLDELASAGKLYSSSAGASITQSNLMAHIWGKARAEWVGRFI